LITTDDLDRVLAWMLAAGLQSLSVAEGDARLVLKLAGTTPDAPAATVEVTTRAMGVFLPSHPRRPDSAVKPGDQVDTGATVGFLRSGPTLVPITAETAGRVVAIIAEPGALLGYGAPVLTLGQGG
jgi:acetyl-CoA carboxylase biotin carboxyl carrier protein